MRRTNLRVLWISALLALHAATSTSQAEFLQLDPPADADKPGLPNPPNDDLRCWAATAANLLASAGYGTGGTLQTRSDDIFADLTAQFGFDGGWIDTGLNWWLSSGNNTQAGTNPFTVVTVYGNKTKVPWANSNGAKFIGNELRQSHFVGLSLSWPTAGSQGSGGHAISAFGDSGGAGTLGGNPSQVIVTDSDRDPATGVTHTYTYDAYNNPNPGGNDNGNGWYLNYSNNHPFIKHIAVLSATDSVTDNTKTQKVVGSYKIKQNSVFNATDLHYRVGTDVNILSYKTQIDWNTANAPTIVENQVNNQRRSLDVNWNLSGNPVPRPTEVTITSQFVLPTWNSISYSNVHFTYPDLVGEILPEFNWQIRTPLLDNLRDPNITGGNVIGSFELFADSTRKTPLGEYRFMHEYDWDQDPELHDFLLNSVGETSSFYVGDLRFGHSYGSLEDPLDLWAFNDWMTADPQVHLIGPGSNFSMHLNWEGLLPYPERETFTIYDPILNAPEPSTALLLACGSLLVLGRGKSRWKRKESWAVAMLPAG